MTETIYEKVDRVITTAELCELADRLIEESQKLADKIRRQTELDEIRVSRKCDICLQPWGTHSHVNSACPNMDHEPILFLDTKFTQRRCLPANARMWPEQED
jgi:hypothetical protein